MKLNDALKVIAKHAGFDPNSLIRYAAEDTVGGRGQGGYNGWSIDADEGKVLYALVRALKPLNVLELGVYAGASTAHLLASLDVNDSGVLTSYDLQPNAASRHKRWTFHIADVRTAKLPAAEFVFEDADHSLDGATETLTNVRALNPRIVVVHDYNMTAEHGDFHVKEAFDAVFPEGFSVTLDGCERGLGIWVNPFPPPSPEMPLTKDELSGVIGGDALEVKTTGEAKLNRKRAPDKVTRRPSTASTSRSKKA